LDRAIAPDVGRSEVENTISSRCKNSQSSRRSEKRGAINLKKDSRIDRFSLTLINVGLAPTAKRRSEVGVSSRDRNVGLARIASKR